MKKSVHFGIFIVVIWLCANTKGYSYSEPMKTNLVIISAGSWMVFPPNDDISFYNKFTTTVYSSGKSFRRVCSFPCAWTVKTAPVKEWQRFFPGDLDLSFATRFYWLEPRAGLLVPCGYALDEAWKKKPWIGSNNLKLQAGFSISRSHFEEVGLPFGLEMMMSYALTDENAHYRIGSIGTQLYLKTGRSLTKKITAGAELAIYGKSAVWKWDNSHDNAITFMPALSGNYRFGKKWYAGVKAGFGPSFRLDRGFFFKSNAADIGMSLLYFP